MPLPTGSGGISWITGSLNAAQISLNLPTTYSYVYQSERTPTMSSAISGIGNYSIYYRILNVKSYSTASEVVFGNVDKLTIYQTSNIGFGLIDTQFVEYQPAEVILTLHSSSLRYALTQAPSRRKGLFLSRHSGSPQLSIEPVWPPSSWHLPGDMWMLETESIARGMYFADFHPNTQFASESIVPHVLIGGTVPDTFDGGTW